MTVLKFFFQAKNILRNLENSISHLFFGFTQHPNAAFLPLPINQQLVPKDYSLIDSLKDAFLFAVPASRRTVQKRRNRKFGNPRYHWKMLVPKTNIKVCNSCGHYHQLGFLCANCYSKIKQETEAMQKAILSEQGLQPIEKEVVIIYENDEIGKSSEHWEGKRIVEMKKERPSWFSKNLLQKSTEDNTEDSTTNKLKPSDLA